MVFDTTLFLYDTDIFNGGGVNPGAHFIFSWFYCSVSYGITAVWQFVHTTLLNFHFSLPTGFLFISLTKMSLSPIMTSTVGIKIYFGPYEAHGLIRHKTQRLYGIMSHLSQIGYEIELIPTSLLNVLTIHMKDKEIFRCDIRNLKFNVDYEDDVVAQGIAACVEEAKTRMYADENIPTFPIQASQSIHHTQSLFSADVNLLYEIQDPWKNIRNEEKQFTTQYGEFMLDQKRSASYLTKKTSNQQTITLNETSRNTSTILKRTGSKRKQISRINKEGKGNSDLDENPSQDPDSTFKDISSSKKKVLHYVDDPNEECDDLNQKCNL